MLTEEQRLARKLGLGGSDIAAICGMNPYKTAMDVWLDKTSDHVDEEQDNLNMEVGNALEALVADTYLKHRNEGKIPFANPGVTQYEIETVVHHEFPYLRANVDRVISDDGVLEVKTALSFGSQKQWREGIPDYHRYQIAFYAWVLDAPYIDVAVLCVGEKTPRYYRYERDSEFESYIIDTAHAFWKHCIQEKNEPSTEIASYEKKAIEGIEACESMNQLIKDLADVRTYKEHVIEQEEHMKSLIAEYIAGHEKLTYKGKTLATYKSQSRSTFDSTRFKKDKPDVYAEYVKTSECRVLRVTATKKEES